MTDLLQSTTTETLFAWSSPVPETRETDRGSASLRASQNDGQWLTSISSWSRSSSDLPEHGTSSRISQPESESDALPSSTSTRPLRSGQSETGVGCWQAVLADLLDQALTVDTFIGAARQAFGKPALLFLSVKPLRCSKPCRPIGSSSRKWSVIWSRKPPAIRHIKPSHPQVIQVPWLSAAVLSRPHC